MRRKKEGEDNMAIEGLVSLIPYIVLAVIIIITALLIISASYTVVPAWEAHIVISRSKGRKFYCSREGYKSSYWKVPFVQQRAIIPIENVKILVNDITLRDSNYAPFIADVMCWVNIIDPLLAAERYGLLQKGIQTVMEEVSDIVKTVTRNSSMYWKITDIMQKRRDFSESVEKNINEELVAWGTNVVELEVIHFQDFDKYTVIQDLQERQATVINAETKKLVATQNKEATQVEAVAQKDAEITKAESEELYKTRQIEKDETIGKREQEKEMTIQETKQKANVQQVEAERTISVGQAKYKADATIEEAQGKAEATRKIGQATADVVKMTGTAEANVIEAKGTAEGVAIDKKATAQKKYETPQAMSIEIITRLLETYKDIQKSMFTNFGPALEKANIRVISTGEAGTFLGMPVGAKSGVGLGGMLEALSETTGIDFGEMIKQGVGAVKDVAKTFIKTTDKPTPKKPKKQKE